MNKSRFDEWRNDAAVQRTKHIWLARIWFAFGVHGALRYSFPSVYSIGPDFATSLACLFFLSVYDIYETHRAEAGTYRVEEKQESAGS